MCPLLYICYKPCKHLQVEALAGAALASILGELSFQDPKCAIAYTIAEFPIKVL